MFHPQDIELILQMTGKSVEKMPKNFEEEYETRLRMLHRTGSSTPLGSTHLIPLLREFAQGPNKEAIKEVNDWERVPFGTLIEHERGLGRLVGIVSTGSVAIRLNGDEEIFEAPSHSIKLADVSAPEVVIPEDDKTDQEPVQYQGDGDSAEDAGSELPSVDWSKVKEDQPVRVGEGDHIQEGHFISVEDEGSIKVNLEGKELMFDPSQVQLSPF